MSTIVVISTERAELRAALRMLIDLARLACLKVHPAFRGVVRALSWVASQGAKEPSAQAARGISRMSGLGSNGCRRSRQTPDVLLLLPASQ
eukprot:680505-Prymnesium_polylepis.1